MKKSLTILILILSSNFAISQFSLSGIPQKKAELIVKDSLTLFVKDYIYDEVGSESYYYVMNKINDFKVNYEYPIKIVKYKGEKGVDHFPLNRNDYISLIYTHFSDYRNQKKTFYVEVYIKVYDKQYYIGRSYKETKNSIDYEDIAKLLNKKIERKLR